MSPHTLSTPATSTWSIASIPNAMDPFNAAAFSSATLIFVATIVAVFGREHLAAFYGILGCSVTFCNSIVFPLLFHRAIVMSKKPQPWRMGLHVLILVFGVFGALCGVSSSVCDLIQKSDGPICSVVSTLSPTVYRMR